MAIDKLKNWKNWEGGGCETVATTFLRRNQDSSELRVFTENKNSEIALKVLILIRSRDSEKGSWCVIGKEKHGGGGGGGGGVYGVCKRGDKISRSGLDVAS